MAGKWLKVAHHAEAYIIHEEELDGLYKLLEVLNGSQSAFLSNILQKIENNPLDIEGANNEGPSTS